MLKTSKWIFVWQHLTTTLAWERPQAAFHSQLATVFFAFFKGEPPHQQTSKDHTNVSKSISPLASCYLILDTLPTPLGSAAAFFLGGMALFQCQLNRQLNIALSTWIGINQNWMRGSLQWFSINSWKALDSTQWIVGTGHGAPEVDHVRYGLRKARHQSSEPEKAARYRNQHKNVSVNERFQIKSCVYLKSKSITANPAYSLCSTSKPLGKITANRTFFSIGDAGPDISG